MIQYNLHKNFIKVYRKLPEKLRKIVKSKLTLFCYDPFEQELNNHALSGKYQGYRSINITGDYRAIYININEERVLFVRIGTHSQMYG